MISPGLSRFVSAFLSLLTPVLLSRVMFLYDYRCHCSIQCYGNSRPAAIRGLMTPRNFFFLFSFICLLGRLWVWFGLENGTGGS